VSRFRAALRRLWHWLRRRPPPRLYAPQPPQAQVPPTEALLDDDTTPHVVQLYCCEVCGLPRRSLYARRTDTDWRPDLVMVYPCDRCAGAQPLSRP
jgi:hypothetical protein